MNIQKFLMQALFVVAVNAISSRLVGGALADIQGLRDTTGRARPNGA